MTNRDGADGEQTARIMIVEDDVLIAMDLAMQIEALGYDVCGPFHDGTSAMSFLDAHLPHAAILDFNLNRTETSKPIAERLIAQEIPVTFLSGYAATDLLKQAGMESCEALSKPVTQVSLEKALKRMIATVGVN